MSLENAPTADVLPEEDAITITSLTPVVYGARSSFRLEGAGAAEALLIEESTRVPRDWHSVSSADLRAAHPELLIRLISLKGR